MPGPDPLWTPALVLCGLRLAYAAQPRFDEPPASFAFIADRAREVLGEDSPDWAALVLRVAPAPGLSIREMCRERYGWHHSRSELYRRSNNGAMWVATSLSDDGIAVPECLQTGP
jgi:hypothetical protein